MIDREAILHLEQLARIDLTEEERERLGEQLQRIVSFFEQLETIDTEGVEPTSSVIVGSHLTLREDETRPGLDRDEVLREAPDAADGFFRVPRIIER